MNVKLCKIRYKLNLHFMLHVINSCNKPVLLRKKFPRCCTIVSNIIYFCQYTYIFTNLYLLRRSRKFWCQLPTRDYIKILMHKIVRILMRRLSQCSLVLCQKSRKFFYQNFAKFARRKTIKKSL